MQNISTTILPPAFPERAETVQSMLEMNNIESLYSVISETKCEVSDLIPVTFSDTPESDDVWEEVDPSEIIEYGDTARPPKCYEKEVAKTTGKETNTPPSKHYTHYITQTIPELELGEDDFTTSPPPAPKNGQIGLKSQLIKAELLNAAKRRTAIRKLWENHQKQKQLNSAQK